MDIEYVIKSHNGRVAVENETIMYLKIQFSRSSNKDASLLFGLIGLKWKK